MFKKIDPKQTFPKMEEEVLKFWNENKIFEKSLEIRKDAKRYSFYDGPPFATGTPHYGHIVASTMKDVVPRYWTMRGYLVERKWGWDCHGLPIENIAEKELGIKRKTEIEEMGVEKFNEFCRSKVLGYVSEWKKVINRLGRWADMENAYSTMDLPYMESIWWVFKELWDKGLIYEGYRSMHICTRCETTLSQQEVSEGYKDIKDLSAIAKFELVDELGTFVLAWTTTPWTLIGNVALAVGKDITYVKVRTTDSHLNTHDSTEFYILAKERLTDIFKDKEVEIIEEFLGKDLVGKKYKPLIDYYVNKGLQNEENGWKIYAADFVTTEEGTGVVHIAPAFGEDDLNLSYQYKLPFIQHVGMDGLIKEEATDFAGFSVKPQENHQKTDIEVIKYLAHSGLLFSKEKYEHSYPHCWRCDTPLINYATSSWFVKVTGVKERALELAKDINWSPKHIKEGRFGNWLEGARDWSISRQRYWASVMPIWKCSCGEMRVFGSIKKLEEASGEKVTDLHKHVVDKITFKCEKCNGTMKRIPDVLDTWFDSGSMPYAQMHYPFENKEKFEAGFPAEFIAEGVDQTRAWFYYLHVIGTAIKDSNAYNNVIVNGIVLAEDGKKMAKRLKNYPDPTFMFEKYGADALRFYLMSSPVVAAENLNFKESDVSDLVRGMFRMLWNSYSFFVLYANIDDFKPRESLSQISISNLLDKWIISELHTLIQDVNSSMENYELNKACRVIPKFIDNLSNWYIRRSRKRFWKSEDDGDKENAYQTLHTVLVELSKLMAPFTPFISEEIYRNLTAVETRHASSVHLADFPMANKDLIDEKLNQEMGKTREIITEALQLRAKAGIKVRQPLSELRVTSYELRKDFIEIVKEEVNVKDVVVQKGEEPKIELNTEITGDLKLEGQAREIIRFIQEMRKEAGYEVDNRIKVCYSGKPEVFEKFGELIQKEVLATELIPDKIDQPDLEKEFEMEGELKISIKR
ncbi:MAG TPA: isoleucine--tRNA ligase [Candidatus Moranbacteria bacterium]|nr:isoleucine--tRNA ligase [Candidatus Moranbacteria bacterium]